MLEQDPLAYPLRNADIYEYTSLQITKDRYEICEELRIRSVEIIERGALAPLSKDADMNLLHSKLWKANEEIYEELREEGSLNLRAGYFRVRIERR